MNGETMTTPTDPTAINWQGDLNDLPLDLLLKRGCALAHWIAFATFDGADPKRGALIDVLAAYGAYRDERIRRCDTGDWNHDGRGEWS